MKKISLLLVVLIVVSLVMPLSSCDLFIKVPTINGVSLKEFIIVYDKDSLDYNQRAAEYIQSKLNEQFKLNLEIVDDDTPKAAHEIVVGETSRDISVSLDAETGGLEFSILAKDGSVALEGDYFVIAAAAYYFIDTYASSEGQESTISEKASVHTPIVKEAKNYVMLIGDGMGVYQTRLFEYLENDCEYGDGEDLFYGYMLPYMGYSRTDSYSGTTDSAAGGTALSTGYKTLNSYLGLNIAGDSKQSLTELAFELGKATAVMSTENETGATPASFLVHVQSRDYDDIIGRKIMEHREKYGTFVDCGFDYYNARYMGIIEDHVTSMLDKVSSDEDGFFLMYEEAYIDKHCHNNEMDNAFLAVIRFNQVIARFMEFAFYNPETFILITADHETGKLWPEEDGTLAYHHDDHSSENVLIFAYGQGAELFDGVEIENIQIAHTIAALMGIDNFGDQRQYQSLTKPQQ